MHSTILRKVILLIFITGLLLPACSTGNPLPVPTVKAIATIIPLESATQVQTTAPTKTPTVEPSVTWTPEPSPTEIIVPTQAAPSEPLSENGPWLVVTPDEMIYQSAFQFLVMNADGSAVQPVSLPALPTFRAWLFLSEPNGRFIAFRTIPIEGASYAIEPNGVDDFVWVVKLPENKIVKKLPLLSEAAWQTIRKKRASKSIIASNGFEIISVQLGLVTDSRSYQWSPDGRYLAYSAALDGKGTDLYLYDTEKDVIWRLTYGREGAQAWFWSPDSKTVLFSNGSSYDFGSMFPGLFEPDGRYAYNLSNGEERKLYKPESEELIFSPSDRDFLVADFYFESSPQNLREVNYQTGAIRNIFKDLFYQAAAADEGSERVILLLFNPSMFLRLKEGFKAGVYRVNAGSGKLELVLEGIFGGMNYETSLGLFSIRPEWDSEMKDTILIDRNGVEKLRLKNTLGVESSPDGKWTIGGRKLYNASGEAMTEEKWGTTIWLRDSSGFFAYSRDEDIRFYGESRDWKPVRVYEGKVNEVFVIEKR